MSFLPVPDEMRGNLYEITPEMFTNRGIRFIILDIDNTVAPYTIDRASPEMQTWVQTMKDAGLELFILSNNRGHRPEEFAGVLGLPFVKKAWKPFTRQAKAVMRERQHIPRETAFIGDQIYTDVACAKWCGAFAVLVHPIEFHRFILRFRYWLEVPFRLAAQRKLKKERHDP